MSLSLDTIIQYGGWAVGIGASVVLGRQQLELGKFKIALQAQLKEYEDGLDARFDKHERETIQTAGELSERISINTTKVNSASGNVKMILKYSLLKASDQDLSLLQQEFLDVIQDI